MAPTSGAGSSTGLGPPRDASLDNSTGVASNSLPLRAQVPVKVVQKTVAEDVRGTAWILQCCRAMDEAPGAEATQRLICGALAGLVATAPMTAVIAFGDAAGLLRTPPPAQITANVAERAGEDPRRQSPQFTAAWLAAHFGYGAACGALYALARPLLPAADATAGLLFGGAVWGVSYLGLLPALALFPPAEEDVPSRQAVMIAAHAVYGLTLAGVDQALRDRIRSA